MLFGSSPVSCDAEVGTSDGCRMRDICSATSLCLTYAQATSIPSSETTSRARALVAFGVNYGQMRLKLAKHTPDDLVQDFGLLVY